MTQVVDGYFWLLKILIALFLAIMVVLVFGNVVLRYAFNSGITVSEEVSRWLFVWLTFLGAIVAMREHGHLGVDTLVKRLPTAGKKACLIVSQLLMLYATWLLLGGSWEQTMINWDVAAPASGLSTGLFYGVGIVFAVSTGLILLADLYRAVTGQLSERSWSWSRSPRSRRSSRPCSANSPSATAASAGSAPAAPINGSRAAMTIAIFVGSLLGAMAIGMPIAYALLICGIALMHYLDIFDAQIVAQNVINGADSFPLLAVPFFMLAGEIMNTGGLSKRIVDVALAAGRPRQGRPRLRRHPGRLHPLGAVRLGRRRCCGALGAARADDGRGRPRQGALGRPHRRLRRDRAGDPAAASASSSSASSAACRSPSCSWPASCPAS